MDIIGKREISSVEEGMQIYPLEILLLAKDKVSEASKSNQRTAKAAQQVFSMSFVKKTSDIVQSVTRQSEIIPSAMGLSKS